MTYLVTRMAALSVALGSIGLLLAMFLGVADVIGTRYGHPVAGALEFTESTMVLIVFGTSHGRRSDGRTSGWNWSI